MFRLLPDLPPHAVGFVVDGTVTAPDIEMLFGEVEAAIARGPVHLVGEITGVGGLTLAAVGAQLRRAVRLLTKLDRVRRYAVVTDTDWIGGMARAENLIFWGMDIRVWPRAERDAAVAWASEPPAA